MTTGGSSQVDIPALENYATQLGYYQAESGKFSELVNRADVTNDAWGIVGVWAKQSYTDRLAELRALMEQMRQGVDALTEKVTLSAAIYRGNEKDQAMRFGKHEAVIDGPREGAP
ncbi:hypothetical protein [Kibdelosporangium phytohabitans]|nr:hypothetical protein [Kibdelosporangium phytohabitans]MBE1465022.1 hypothetical protein [Kibdelosporangium phytohabitans]